MPGNKIRWTIHLRFALVFLLTLAIWGFIYHQQSELLNMSVDAPEKRYGGQILITYLAAYVGLMNAAAILMNQQLHKKMTHQLHAKLTRKQTITSCLVLAGLLMAAALVVYFNGSLLSWVPAIDTPTLVEHLIYNPLTIVFTCAFLIAMLARDYRDQLQQ